MSPVWTPKPSRDQRKRLPIANRRVKLSAIALLFAALASAQNNRVLVVYNAGIRESREVANYYIAKRSIPERNVCPIRAPSADNLEPKEFESRVKEPIRKCLEEAGKDKILYIVFSYQTPFALTINGQNYALDSFIADIWDEYLPARPANPANVQPYFGYAQSEGGVYQPFVPLSAYREQPGARHIYSVWRIDAATPALAKGLVDKALFAEAHGLSGKACFDLTGAPAADFLYASGELGCVSGGAIRPQSGVLHPRRHRRERFGTPPAPMRCDDAALYAGWYSLNHYNDAFSWNPGAIGIHLDSASAVNPRSGPNWVANAVSKGNHRHQRRSGRTISRQYSPSRSGVLVSLRRRERRRRPAPQHTPAEMDDPQYRRPALSALSRRTPASPSHPAWKSFSGLLPQMSVGDGTSSALIGLSAPAPEGGMNFSVKADRPDLVTVPPMVSIAAGANRVQFAIQASAVSSDGTAVKISVAANQLARSNTLVLFPLLAAVAANPARIRGGSPASGSVMLHHAAPAVRHHGNALGERSGDCKCTPRDQSTRGQTTATFPITTHAGAAQSSNTVTASYGGVNRTAP